MKNPVFDIIGKMIIMIGFLFALRKANDLITGILADNGAGASSIAGNGNASADEFKTWVKQEKEKSQRNSERAEDQVRQDANKKEQQGGGAGGAGGPNLNQTNMQKDKARGENSGLGDNQNAQKTDAPEDGKPQGGESKSGAGKMDYDPVASKPMNLANLAGQGKKSDGAGTGKDSVGTGNLTGQSKQSGTDEQGGQLGTNLFGQASQTDTNEQDGQLGTNLAGQTNQTGTNEQSGQLGTNLADQANQPDTDATTGTNLSGQQTGSAAMGYNPTEVKPLNVGNLTGQSNNVSEPSQRARSYTTVQTKIMGQNPAASPKKKPPKPRKKK